MNPRFKKLVRPYTPQSPMQDADGFTKYSKGGLTQGPTNLNSLQTHVEFGTTPWVMMWGVTYWMKYLVTY